MLTAYLQFLSIFQMGSEMYLLIAQHTRKACILLKKCDSKWHSTEFSAPNAKGCDPATRDCRGGRRMTQTVKRVQSVLCHSSCYTFYFPAQPCTPRQELAGAALQVWNAVCSRALPHTRPLTAARSLSDVPARSVLSTGTLRWGAFGVDRQQKGHICDDVSAGIKEDREGTARGKQMEKPPGDPGWSKDS